MNYPYKLNAELSQSYRKNYQSYHKMTAGGGGGLANADDNKNIGLLRLFLFYGRYYGGFTQSGNIRGKTGKKYKNFKCSFLNLK